MGARQSFQSEIAPRQRSSSSSEESAERSRRLQNVRNGENFSTDSDDFDGNDFASSSAADPTMRYSFRPGSRVSFLQALTTGMNSAHLAHSSHSEGRDRRAVPALRFLDSRPEIVK
ncbi:unnamed protein product [Bursaphelenchus okinawaensis]|uniref:Uncharacterized protein n=1 Tax=Bursaphelenchus okinawaensis TaxID=465554 RepID=A0A811JVF5_9BILA|nr:unnamed protein product [Bursaphelenchus okinawaensis]CAG9084924.1 unnamed protein product [Bursaphelenchus okinawaensis]